MFAPKNDWIINENLKKKDGTQGLAPSNYLSIENDVYDLPKKHFDMDNLYDELPCRRDSPEQPYDILPNRKIEDVYDLPRAIIKPDTSDEDYDELPVRRIGDQNESEIYDLPRNMNNNNLRKIEEHGEENEDDYDLPRPFLSPKKEAEDEYDELPTQQRNAKINNPMRNSGRFYNKRLCLTAVKVMILNIKDLFSIPIK